MRSADTDAEGVQAVPQAPVAGADQRFKGRDFILAVDDAETVELEVPQWNTWVRVKALTGAERDRYEQDILTGKGKNREVNLVNARAKLIARSVVDDKGERLFSEGDVTKLGAKNAAALQIIYDQAATMCGLSDADLEELSEGFTEGQP